MTTSRQAHWDNIYTTKREAEVSWFEEIPKESLELLQLVGARPSSAIIDVGGGASRLVDSLVAKGFQDITVLDLSAAALDTARVRLGAKRDKVSGLSPMRRNGGRQNSMTFGTIAPRFTS
jgi:2-polyprenyl-3-methyl-5-hydroxy-6-metoxy-1,4-benzoquinol methylase